MLARELAHIITVSTDDVRLALIGGDAGAAVAKAGFSAVILSGWTKAIISMVLSPLLGLAAGLGLMTAILWIFRWVPPSRPPCS